MSISAKFNLKCRQKRQSQASFVLILTLALVTILSLIVVAFLFVSQLGHSASFSYSQSLKADQLAQGSLQLVVSQLQQEMAKDAPPDTGGGAYPNAPVYTNVNYLNILPQSVGTNSAMPDLIIISTNAAFYTGTLASGAYIMSSSIASSAPSRNNRTVGINRWNLAYLGNFPNASNVPYWVIVTRAGITNAATISPTFGASANSLNNPSPANPNYAIGRFAYAIYDEGSLLDITAAGYPASMASSAQNLTLAQINQLKGTLAGADLSVFGGNITPSSLIAWRNPASSASAGTYVGFFTNGYNGSTTTYGLPSVYTNATSGDTTFLSRHDLIAAAQNGTVTGLTTNALPYLTTFTRELNAPSWGPTLNAGGAYNYASMAYSNSYTVANRFTPMVRYNGSAGIVTNYEVNGTPYTYTVSFGDPLLQHRFPLDRLSWIGPSGPQNGGTAANIQACFGLSWGPALADTVNTPAANVWRYVGPTGTTEQNSIETLAQIAAESSPRQPNFFELLQAGILSGSVGVFGGATTAGQAFPHIHQQSGMLQILRIGANIMNQYNSDSYPRVIEYSDTTIAAGGVTCQAVGLANLPYLNSYNAFPGLSPNASTNIALYSLFGLWNSTQGSPPGGRPAIRLHTQGNLQAFYSTTVTTNTTYSGFVNLTNPANSTYIQLSTNAVANGVNGFATPGLLTPADVINGTSLPSPGLGKTNQWEQTPSTMSTNTYVAYRFPDLIPHVPLSNNGSVTINYSYQVSGTTNASQFSLQYQDPNGNWIPYQYLNGVNAAQTWPQNFVDNYSYTNFATAPSVKFQGGPVWFLSDPRSLRFGPMEILRTAATAATDPLWPATQADGYGGNHGSTPGVSTATLPVLFGTSFYYPATLCLNNTANSSPTSSYPDSDGVQRIADSGLFTASFLSSAQENPYQGTLSRSVILNRPFQSIGELGYVFRDSPWKSLDFFSTNSADAALLDLFTVNQDTSPIVAGKISLNSRNALALQAVLNNTMYYVSAAGNTLGTNTVNQPANIAAALVSYTQTNPLANKADLMKFIGSALLSSTNSAPDFQNIDEQNIKTQREATVRALADVGQTRTWNLMIDLVAQVGKYPPNAGTMDQFIVEGERRYWLHVAIDRFTGKVIAENIEPAAE